MNKIINLKTFFTVLLTMGIVSSGAVLFAETDEDGDKAEVTVQAGYLSVDDSPSKLGEYLPYKEEHIVNGFIRSNISLMDGDPNSLSLYGQFIGNSQYRFGTEFYTPGLKMYMDVNSFYHFLDNDTLKNYYILENPTDAAYYPPPGPGVGATSRKVWKDNFDPGAVHGIQKSRIDMGVSFDIIDTDTKTFTPYIQVSSEKRLGHSQSSSFSMCSACHIQGRTRQLNDQSNEVKMGTTFATVKNFVADISFFFRQFGVDAAEPTYIPNSIFSPFDYDTWTDYGYTIANWDQFMNVTGGPKLLYGGKELPYDNIPENKEFGGELEFSVPFSDNTNLNIHGLYSTAKGEYNDIKTITKALSAIFASSPLINSSLARPFKFMSFTFSAKYENLDVKNSINAQVAELEKAYDDHIIWDVGSPAGQANFEMYYDIALQQLVEPTLARDCFTGELSMAMPLSRNNLFRLSYIYQDIDRDDFEVSDTSTHKLKALLRGKLAKNLRYRANAEYEHTSHPFGNLRGAGEEDIELGHLGQMGTYLLMSELRKKSITSVPEDKYGGRFELTYSPDIYLFNWNVGYTQAENDWATNLDSRNYYSNISASVAPTEKTNFALSYGYNRAKVESTMWQSVTIFSFGMIVRSYGNYTPTIEDRLRSQVASFSAFHKATDKFSLDGTLNYVRSVSGFTNPGSTTLDLLIGGGAATTVVDMSAMHKYSVLDYDIWESAFGAEYQLNKNTGISGSIGYTVVDDDYGFVYGDQSGNGFNCRFGVTWRGL